MERKDFFKKGIFQALKKVVDATEEVYDVIHKSVVAEKPSEEVPASLADKLEYVPKLPKVSKSKKIKRLKFPPGALKEKGKFLQKCTGCGDCIQACPHETLFPVQDDNSGKKYPYLDPNLYACMMCPDYPCISACEAKALKPLKKNESLKFGRAKLIVEHCINNRTKANTCNVCQTSCPVEKVVTYTKLSFLPRFSKNCTGCGICVKNCPPFLKAIVVN